MRIFLVVWFLLYLQTTFVKCGGECPTQKCQTTEKHSAEIVIFNQNGRPLSSASRAMIVNSPNVTTACVLDTNQLVEKFKIFSNQDFIGNLAFMCVEPFEIYFSPYTGSYLENVIGYLQISKCIVNFQNLNVVTEIVDMRVVTFYKAVLTSGTDNCTNENTSIAKCNDRNDTNDNNNYTIDNSTVTNCSHGNGTSDTDNSTSENSMVAKCNGLLPTVSFTVYPLPGYQSPDVESLLSCQDVFPSMTEVSFANMSWNVVPDDLKVKFPNLQALEVPVNNLTVPPDFPWTEQEVELPRNLSRSQYFQSHYSKVFHVNIKAHIYRRLLNLNNNRIYNLSDYQFRGYLHMLYIASNGLREVGPDTFQSLRGLQHLTLSNNKLESLPGNVFRNLNDLQHLDLSKNQFQTFPERIFDRLYKLKYLNLANNSLEILPTRLLYYVNSLEELHLELNKLTVISPNVLPIESVKLDRVYLQNNPLTIFPESLFYIRHLTMADLRNTSISWNISRIILETDQNRLAHSVVVSASDSQVDITKTPDKLKIINLEGSKISSFDMVDTLDKYQKRIFLLILKNFKFILDKNPICCNCKINTFRTYVTKFISNNTLSGKEYFFKDWKCAMPSELKSIPMFSVPENDTYCETEVEFCPAQCICYKRYKLAITIVDCRRQFLSTLPVNLPTGILDLWFQDNNITTLERRLYLNRVRQLHISRNSLNKLNPQIVIEMTILEEIFLDSNLLQNIPSEIRNLPLREVRLHDNPFECNCHALWMKSWLLQYPEVVRDSNLISCSSEKEEGRKLIVTPDGEFVCIEEFDSLHHVIIPTVCSSVALAALVIITGFLFAYRLEVKVLLYVYFGIHPFDKDEDSCTEKYDVAIVHAPCITSWVMEHIVATLEREGHSFIVCEIMRDFIAGFSYQENITSAVRRSKRILIILSPSLFVDNDLFKLSWTEAEQKIKEIRTNYAIVICHDLSAKSLKNKDLKNFSKRNRLIASTDRLFKEKLLYLMPITKSDVTENAVVPHVQNLNASVISMDTISVHTFQQGIPVFVSYAEDDVHYVVTTVVPELERFGFNLCLPDRDFVLGASKEENILHAIDSCDHTLFIISGDKLQDEWLLFTFRCANEKSLREKSNHLIVVLLENVNVDVMDEEIQYYIRTHVTLKTGNPWFWKRVRDALTGKKLETQLLDFGSREDLDITGRALLHLKDVPMNNSFPCINVDKNKIARAKQSGFATDPLARKRISPGSFNDEKTFGSSEQNRMFLSQKDSSKDAKACVVQMAKINAGNASEGQLFVPNKNKTNDLNKSDQNMTINQESRVDVNLSLDDGHTREENVECRYNIKEIRETNDLDNSEPSDTGVFDAGISINTSDKLVHEPGMNLKLNIVAPESTLLDNLSGENPSFSNDEEKHNEICESCNTCVFEQSQG